MTPTSGKANENAKGSEKLAIKIFTKKLSDIDGKLQSVIEGTARKIQTEIEVHWRLDSCDGVLRMLEIFEDDTQVFLVLEYQEFGTL